MSNEAITTPPKDNGETEFPFGVLIEEPRIKHIPYFEMPLAMRHPNHAFWVTDDPLHLRSKLPGAVADQVERGDFGRWQVQTHRNRDRQAAILSDWLMFTSKGEAERFISTHQEFGLDRAIRHLKTSVADRQAQIEGRVKIGEFDLSVVPARKRKVRAGEYLRLQDDLSSDRVGLQMLATVKTSSDGLDGFSSIGLRSGRHERPPRHVFMHHPHVESGVGEAGQ